MTAREIYALTGRDLKNFRKFYNTYRHRYGILSPDEELETDIELALLVEVDIYTILDVIRALTDDDYDPDPPEVSVSNIINFEKESKSRKEKTIIEQHLEICALKDEVSHLKSEPTMVGIKNSHKIEKQIPTMGRVVSKRALEKEIEIINVKIRISKNPKMLSMLKEYRKRLKAKLIL